MGRCALKTSQKITSAAFVAIELIMYYFILTASGSLLVWASFFSILLCFLYACITYIKSDNILVAALFCTVCADYCLVIMGSTQRFMGMMFFFGVQMLYALRLLIRHKNRWLYAVRIALTLLSPILVFSVLGKNADRLATISVMYYINLIFNIIVSAVNFKKNKVYLVALVLFLLCDTVIGLQVAAGGYLPIPPDSALYKIIFPPFNLSWMFYLPSQVLIALSGRKSAVRK